MLEITDLQTDIEIPFDELNNFVSAAAGQITGLRGRTVELVFVNDVEMRQLNAKFRGTDSATDVLSFPHNAEEFEDDKRLGEIIVSTGRVVEQARAAGISNRIEMKQLLLHGILHLLGYDHETDNGEMDSLEIKLRDKLGITE